MRKISEEVKAVILQHKEEEFNGILGGCQSPEAVYHLSDLRTNLIRWIEIGKGDRVLEIGSECGALTSYLGQKAGELVCIEPSAEMMTLNQKRNEGTKEIRYLCMEAEKAFAELEKESFDLIFMIGFDERIHKEWMPVIFSLLKKKGRFVFAADNKYGLQFFAGNQDEDGRGYFPFTGEEEEDSFRLLSRQSLVELMERAGCKDYRFYYPFPDYRYANSIYSDDYLPRQNELKRSWRNMAQQRMVLFDEESAFRNICRDGLFPLFTNSFLLIGEKNEG